MKYKATYANNFIRIFQLPNEFPSDFCFQGGHPVLIILVDWFNPFDPQDFWGDKIKEFDSTEEWYLSHLKELKDYIKKKTYFNPEYTYMALTDYGDAFVINPEKRADELQEQYERIREQALKEAGKE